MSSDLEWIEIEVRLERRIEKMLLCDGRAQWAGLLSEFAMIVYAVDGA